MDALTSGIGLTQALYQYNTANVSSDELVNRLNAAQSKDDEELKKACQDFESYFIGALLKQMRASNSVLSEDAGIFKKTQAEKIFTEMHDEAIAEKMTENGGFGLANYLYLQLQNQNKGINPADIAIG